MDQSRNYAFSSRELRRLLSSDGRHARKSEVTLPDTDLFGRGSKIEPAMMRALLKANGHKFKRRSYAHLNMRGGIGKTTASINLATRAAQYGFKTCLVDLDPQASATYALVPDLPDEYLVLADIWNEPEAIDDCILQIDPGLLIVPSSLDNSILDDEWDHPGIQKKVIRSILDLLWKKDIDLVVFDAPPSLSSIVISIIAAVDTIVVPVWSDPFSIRGLKLMIQETESISQAFKIRPPEMRVLYSHFDRRLKISDTLFSYVEQTWPKRLLGTRIRTSTEFSKSITKRESIFKNTVKSAATEDYDAYTRELLNIPLPSPF